MPYQIPLGLPLVRVARVNNWIIEYLLEISSGAYCQQSTIGYHDGQLRLEDKNKVISECEYMWSFDGLTVFRRLHKINHFNVSIFFRNVAQPS